MIETTLYLERPSFWSEVRDPDCWIRGMGALARLEIEEDVLYGTPRTLWERQLKHIMSRRSFLGLFGLSPERKERLLLGAGFLEYHPDKAAWKLAECSRELVAGDLKSTEALHRLGLTLLQQSPWIRLLVTRLMQEDWSISNWRYLRDGRGKLKNGSQLIQHRYSEKDAWFSGIERLCINAWMADAEGAVSIRLYPEVWKRDSRRDDFSWAPFKSPLYLFDALGWLADDGVLQIPADILKMTGLNRQEAGNASVLLRRITEQEADLRGFVPLEKVLRAFHAELYPGQYPDSEVFALWMDALMSCALANGSIEILAYEPGQARHGRGLLGDLQRKRVQWMVHEDFKDCFAEFERSMTAATAS